MLVLNETQEPTNEVELVQPQVVTYWERDCLGQGTLYITTKMVVWISNRNRKGFRLPFPSISVHAASGSSDDFSEPCLFLVVDTSKTEIEYSPDGVGDDEEDIVDEDILKTAAIRFVPSDPSAVQHLFEQMNICQEKNPDENDAISSEEGGEDEECGEMELHSNGGGRMEDEGEEGTHQWFTADSDETIQLSAEGQANLQRMLGGLNDGSATTPTTSERTENTMEHLHITSHQQQQGGSSGDANPTAKTDDAMDQG